MKYSGVPVHPGWKAWICKRAVGKKEIESLTAHRMRGIKIYPDNESLAEDISNALKKERLKKGIDYDLLGPLVDICNQLATM